MRGALTLATFVTAQVGPTLGTAPRLEFLHIQKNAGTLLEHIAMQEGIAWGVCHFDFPWKGRKWEKCPAIVNTPKSRTCYWHYPLQHYDRSLYNNLADRSLAEAPVSFFAVVRNPYDRLVSLGNHYLSHSPHHRNSWRQHAKRIAQYQKRNQTIDNNGDDEVLRAIRERFQIDERLALNKFVWKALNNAKVVGLYYPNATICQHQYFFDESSGQAMVDHIARFEHLAEDFEPLAARYNLSQLKVPKRKINAAVHQMQMAPALGYTAKDLDDANIRKLNELCPKDFELGDGYARVES